MATLDERISQLKSEGKSESTSKSLAKLVKQKAKTGGNTTVYGKTGLSEPSSTTDVSSTVKRAMELNRQAVEPAVQSYKAAIPEINKTYETKASQLEAEKTPLTDRFNNLLDRVTSSFSRNRESAIQTTSNELGRRGILGSSGIADRELQAATSSINEQEAQAVTDIGFERESQLRNINNLLANIPNEQSKEIRQILNSIAGLQSTAGMAGISQGQATESAQANAELQKKVFDLITLPTSQANIANIYDLINKRGAENSTSDWEF